MKELSELVLAISGLAWPLIAAWILWSLRARLSEVLSVTIDRISRSSDIELGALKIKGVVITQSGEVIRNADSSYDIEDAQKSEVDSRRAVYAKQRNFFVVHTIKPVEPLQRVDGYRVFNVSVFLHPHREFAHLNDVKQVTYFFGDKWGRGKYGSKFVVRSSNDQFALTAQMYGSSLCVARLEFHDGQSVEIERYLDVEMAPAYGITAREAREQKKD